MIGIESIDFGKLKPYDGKVTKCFEQLCYQIALKEYGHLGKFTPIDGRGGDGGVEFYLECANGDVWGWQCKFYGDSGRLNISNRKTSIGGSLKTACRNHDKLSKWILCLKTDLTSNSHATTGKIQKGEQDWFDNELSKNIPSGRTITLEHWGESTLLTFLASPNHIGLRSFFFGLLEFNQEWFVQKFAENFEKVKEKYHPDLHTIDKVTQSKVDFILFSQDYTHHLTELKKQLSEKADQIDTELVDFRNEKVPSTEQTIHGAFFEVCQNFRNHIILVSEKIDFIEACFNLSGQEALLSFRLEDLADDFEKHVDQIDYSVFGENNRTYRKAMSLYDSISAYGEIYDNFFRNYFHEFQNSVHFISGPGKGKTHLSCHIAYTRILNEEPAIFVTADRFTGESSIAEAFKKILDIPSTYSFDELLAALDIYGSILNKKLPIILDGLNETTENRYFSSIWKNHLQSVISKIEACKNLVLITTCRESYTNRIWKASNKNFHYLNGFNDHKTTGEAVKKYFNKYRIQADFFSVPLEKFSHPLFLNIFCEIKNPNWLRGESVEVQVSEQTTYDVFKEYIEQVNRRVTLESHLLRNNEPFIFESLSHLATYLWDSDLREIPINEFYKIVDGTEAYKQDSSKADILINEGLIVTRDNRDAFEFVQFTYDLLAGYLITDLLLRRKGSIRYLTSNEFISKIVQEPDARIMGIRGRHPLYEDIVLALSELLPETKNISLHELVWKNNKLRFTETILFKRLPKILQRPFAKIIAFSSLCASYSIPTLFNLKGDFVKESGKEAVRKAFYESPQRQSLIFQLFTKTLSINHPLNSEFLWSLLAPMKMNERDLSWSEYLRKQGSYFEDVMSEFERRSRIQETKTAMAVQKQHYLAKAIVWILTSTDRALRDKATRALYYYGCEFPNQLMKLVHESFKINDPYVSERSLASLYGVTMACHNSIENEIFTKEYLPEIGTSLHKLMFTIEAPYSTTHMLARDYGRRIIEICLFYHPDILSSAEISEIRPPYSRGGIRNPGEMEFDEERIGYFSPLHMDFNNYTIGRLVKGGGSYANPPEKIKVRNQIIWRLHDLGWDYKLFEDVEKYVGNGHYSTRHERDKIERYGKKYSWIAFFENAGLRSDLGLLPDEWDEFRISDADIDPSFPERPINEAFISHDLLGDRDSLLSDWYENGGMPHLEEYLVQSNIRGCPGEWVCLDGFIVQEDVSVGRERFAFIRGFLIDEENFNKAVSSLQKQDLGGGWLPEKRANYYTYAGELYLFDQAAYDNTVMLEFEVGRRKKTVKPGDEGYLPALLLKDDEDGIRIETDVPVEIEIEVPEIEEFEVTMPVMDYNWESYHSSVNEAGHETVVVKEIASYLKLISQPQSFDLLHQDGTKASINIHYHKETNNSHTLVYLRKDLFDKYLTENRLKYVWAIWGERQIAFENDEQRKEFFDKHPFKDYQVFQKIIEYNW